MSPLWPTHYDHECHVCHSVFYAHECGNPEVASAEFVHRPIVCPACDAPLRRDVVMNIGNGKAFLFGLYGAVVSSELIGGSQSLFRRAARTNEEIEALLELFESIDIETMAAEMREWCDPDEEDQRELLDVLPRLLEEARSGMLSARLRSMANQAKAELAAELERHSAIFRARRPA